MSKEIDIIDNFIDNQQKLINILQHKALILETRNNYLEKKVKELEDINRKNKYQKSKIRKPVRKSIKKTVQVKNPVKEIDTEFTKESVKMKSIGTIISKLFSKIFHYGGDKNSMKPDDNINSDKKTPLGKHVIRGGLPPMPKNKKLD